MIETLFIDPNEKIVKKRGIGKYEFYVDEGYNGNTMERPALKQLIEDMKTGNIAAMITTHDDRLAKSSPELWKSQKRILNKNNVRFISLQSSFSNCK